MAKPHYRGEHQQRRKAWTAELTRLGSIPCGCTGQCRRHTGPCPTTIRPGDPWHLGHGLAHTHGGDGTDSTPWCPACNDADGANITNTRKAAARRRDDWW